MWSPSYPMLFLSTSKNYSNLSIDILQQQNLCVTHGGYQWWKIYFWQCSTGVSTPLRIIPLVTHIKTHVEYFKNGNKKLCHIKITYHGTLTFHFSRAFGRNFVERCFKKKIGKCTGWIVVNKDNPVELLYNFKTHVLSITWKIPNIY